MFENLEAGASLPARRGFLRWSALKAGRRIASRTALWFSWLRGGIWRAVSPNPEPAKNFFQGLAQKPGRFSGRLAKARRKAAMTLYRNRP
jgi:hypothetical protein